MTTPTFVVYSGNGTQTDFVFPFPYIDTSHVTVTVGGVAASFTTPAQGTVRISPAPASGANNVRIERVTPTAPLVTWGDNPAALGSDLNLATLQAIYIAEEAANLADEASAVLSEAQAAAAAAAASATSAAASADSVATLDDRYLGAKSVAPTVDNHGNALVTGAMYFDTVTNTLYCRTAGGAWQPLQSAHGHAVGDVVDLSAALAGKADAAATAAALAGKQAAAENLTAWSGLAPAAKQDTMTKATQAEAQAGTDDAHWMTPLKTADARNATALGWGQTWQGVTGSRTAGTAYQNTTGRPILVGISGYKATSGYGVFSVSQDGATWQDVLALSSDSTGNPMVVIVPSGGYYKIEVGTTVFNWVELR